MDDESLVTCPLCGGRGYYVVLTNDLRATCDREAWDCGACEGGGRVSERKHRQLVALYDCEEA